METLTAPFADPYFLLIAAAVFVLFIVGGVAHFIVTAPKRVEEQFASIVRELDTMAEKLSEAEKIGSFGSFTWDFEDPSESFWSDEMYNLFGLVRRKKPPAIDVLIQTAHPEDRELVEEAWGRAQREPGSFSFVFRAVSPSGQVRYLRVQGKTLLEANIRLPHIQGVAHDITGEMAVDRAKTEFVSLASHQLKTPLTSVKWLAEVLLTDTAEPLTTTQQKYIGSIREASRHMVDIVNDLLSVSRIELGTFAVRLEEFDVLDLVASVLDEQRHAAEEKHIKVDVRSESGLPHLNADKNLVRMVFQNLISNAIKYTPAEGSVTCELTRSGATRDTIFIRVSDTGIGIPSEERNNVFKKLYRAGNAKAMVPDGTGLGLYVVKAIVERAQGGITFESTEGKGTTFYVSFPLVWKTDGEKSA